MQSPDQGSDSNSSTSTSLLRRVQAGDNVAWEQLVRLYGPLIYYWATKDGCRPEDAADIVQDVFQALTRHIATLQYRMPNRSFRGWLRTVTTSKRIDQLRRIDGEVVASGGLKNFDALKCDMSDDQDANEDSDAHLLVHEALRLVQLEIESRTFEMFWQVAIEERGARDVAKLFGASPGAVYTAKSRVLRRLRELLKDEFD